MNESINIYKMFASLIYKDVSKYIKDNKSEFEEWQRNEKTKQKGE